MHLVELTCGKMLTSNNETPTMLSAILNKENMETNVLEIFQWDEMKCLGS